MHFHMKVKCFVPDLHRHHHRRVHPGDFYLVALVSQQLSENLKMKINHLPINIDPKKKLGFKIATYCRVKTHTTVIEL